MYNTRYIDFRILLMKLLFVPYRNRVVCKNLTFHFLKRINRMRFDIERDAVTERTWV